MWHLLDQPFSELTPILKLVEFFSLNPMSSCQILNSLLMTLYRMMLPKILYNLAFTYQFFQSQVFLKFILILNFFRGYARLSQ